MNTIEILKREREKLKVLQNQLDNVTEPALIDKIVFEINAIETICRHLHEEIKGGIVS